MKKSFFRPCQGSRPGAVCRSLVAAALLASVTSACSDGDNPWASDGGSVRLTLGLDRDIKAARASRASSLETLTVTDLSLRMTGDGFSRTWDSADDFSSDEQFPVGAYTLEAFYGDPADQGFEKPAVAGSASFTVKKDEVTPVSLSASLVNSMVSVTFSDAFKNYFTAASAAVNGVAYALTETRPVYITPGAVDFSVSVTKPNGVSGTLHPVTITAEPRTSYTISVDLAEGTEIGSAALTITFDDALDSEPVVIDITDDILGAAAPVVNTLGFTAGTPIDFTEGIRLPQGTGFDVIADGTVSALDLTINSASLAEQGFPTTIDLMSADAATLASLGVSLRGAASGTKAVRVDLSGITTNVDYLAEGDNSLSFTLTARDAANQVSEPVTLGLNCLCGPYSLSATSVNIWPTKAYIDVTYPAGAAITVTAEPASRASRAGAATGTVSGNVATVTGLQPGTAYVVTLTPATGRPKKITLTTESAQALHNGDFEELAPAFETTINQGGYFYLTRLKVDPKQNKQYIKVSDPDGWTTTNGTTHSLSSSELNSWFVIASVFNTSLNFSSKLGGINQSSQPDAYKHDPQNGANAMVIRNVAYDHAGTIINGNNVTKTIGVTSFCPSSDIPSISSRMAGKLSYEGTFTSRPTSLTGYYTYTRDSQDTSETGVATIKVLNGSTVIGTGSAPLAPASSYTAFTAPITYSRTDLKATDIQVSLSSSNRADDSVKTTNYCSLYLQESTGAVLVVDNLSFAY